MSSKTATSGLKERLEAGESAPPAYLVNPRPELLRALVYGDAETPEIRVIASGTVYREAFGEFREAGRAADMVKDGQLTLRELDTDARQKMVTAESVEAPVSVNGHHRFLTDEEDGFVNEARDYCTDMWDEASEYILRAPPRSDALKTLEEDVGKGVQEDFVDLVESDVDAVFAAIVAGSRNKVLFYDLSRWGEGSGLASKATFSRSKNKLEDNEIVTTEKVPVKVGRPRHRFKLTEEYADMDLDDLAAELRSIDD